MLPPIFIVGCERSGTTLLRFMLNESELLHIPSESWFLHQLVQGSPKYGDFTQVTQRQEFVADLIANNANSKYSSFSIFELNEAEAEALLEQAAPMSFAEAVATLYSACARKYEKPYWADKTPRYVMEMDLIAELYPQAKFIHIIRDGRDVAESCAVVGWDQTIEKSAKRWKQRVEAGIRSGQKLGEAHYYEVYYEDLVCDPRNALIPLCRWLGIPYKNEMLYFQQAAEKQAKGFNTIHKKLGVTVDSTRVGAWRKTMPRKAQKRFEAISGDLLKRLGYSIGTNGKSFSQSLKSIFKRGTEPRLALVCCVQNEERFLYYFLRYHYLLGVRRAYIYLDRCTDKSRAIAESFDWVEVMDVDPNETKDFEYIADIQNLCANDALQRARKGGFDWLLHLDPDEYAFADNAVEANGSSVLARGYLPTLLSQIPKSTEVVQLRTREVVPTLELEKSGLWGELCIQEIDTPITRIIYDPQADTQERWEGLLGHDNGKNIVRTRAKLQSFNAHQWTRPQAVTPPKRPKRVPIETVERGFHYHLVVAGKEHWQEKYTKFTTNPDVWHGGNKPVEPPKKCWKNISPKMDAQAVAEYVDKWVYLSPEQIEKEIAENKLSRENLIAEVLKAGRLEHLTAEIV